MTETDLNHDSYEQITSVTGELVESLCQVLKEEEIVTAEKLKQSISRCYIALEKVQSVQDAEPAVILKVCYLFMAIFFVC